MPSSLDLKSGAPNWTTLQDTAVDDTFRLQSFLGADENSASYSAKPLHEPDLNAVIRLYAAPNEEAAQKQIQLWQQAKTFDHPSLIRVLGAGHVTNGQHSLIYVALEPADERLESVLRERPLDANEAGEILKSLSGALQYLHERNLVHGVLSPEQVFAVGDRIKISTENMRAADAPNAALFTHARYLAPESAEANNSVAADTWCLGATVYETLTQEAPNSENTKLLSLPDPLKTIVERLLDPDPQTRGTLAEINTIQKGEAAAPENEQPIVESVLPAKEEEQQESEPEPVKPKMEPIVMPQTRAAELPKTLHPVKASSKPIPLAVYGLGIILVLSALIWLLYPKTSLRKEATAPTQPVTAAQQKIVPPVEEKKQPAVNANPAVPETDQALAKKSPGVRAHDKSTSAPVRSTALAIQNSGIAENGTVWRVIVYTYNRREDAQNKADQINKKHPQLKAEEFTPKDQNGPYLVALGGSSMNRDAAKKFRQTAIQSGMPRDSYVQNYTH